MCLLRHLQLRYSGHLLVENWKGLIVDAMAWEANGTAERVRELNLVRLRNLSVQAV
jgi:hypothetical protein